MEVYDVVMKLIGPVVPVGETHTDGERLENLEQLTELTDKLVTEIDRIGYENRKDHRYSIKRAVEHCQKFMDSLGIEK